MFSPQRWGRLGESSGTVASDEEGLDNGTYLPNSGGSWRKYCPTLLNGRPAAPPKLEHG